MSISATPKISNQSVNPAPEVANSSVKFRPEFSPPFVANPGADDQKIDDQENKNGGSPEPDGRKNNYPEREGTTKPEIFKLFEKYHFDDFFQLLMSKDDLKLTAVIKKNRKLRGISLLQPLSNGYTGNDDFINQVKELYLHTKLFKEETPGKTFTSTL